jgi:hypothetical protein
MVIVLARSRAGFFPIRTAFPGFATGRRPHCSFRGLLGFHTHYGPPDCSPTLCGLCREVPISPVTRTHRSPAIESNHQLFEWVPPPLVISPFGAHAKPPAPPTQNQHITGTVGQAFSPMSLGFPKIANPAQIVGRTPWSARVPLDPLLANGISIIRPGQADEGVGCGPGGPPHN